MTPNRKPWTVLSLSLLLLVAATTTPIVAAKKTKSPEPAEAKPPESALRALEWREVGPYRGGRCAAVTGIPQERDTYYFGSTGGGVWKTTDGGRSWTSASDGFFGGSIGAVAVSEWDPNVVYVGGGESTVRGNVSHGDGVWKSTDAGKTWTHVGLGDSRHIPRIRIHPKNPDLVYVAALGHLFGPNEERGVYRSRDGGETWEKILFVSPDAGAIDLAMDPTNPRILYASFWRVRRTPYSLESGGEGSSLWKSTDGGDHWTDITRNEGLPRGTLGIIGITVSPTDNQNLYAIVEAEEGGVFRSRDGGETWTRTNDDRSLRQRAWYYSRIYADPADEDSVYVVNVRFHHSKDGGKSFEPIDTPHGDNHDLWIDPGDPDRMIESNDGGANVSTDGGATWSVQSNQPTAQIYRVSTDDDFPYRLLGGQQDNSALRIRSRSAFGNAITERDWEPTAGGESGYVVAKPGDPDIVYGGSYGGFLMRLDHSSGEMRRVDVWPDDPMGWGAADLDYRFQWNFPLFFSPHDPDTLYAAAQMLFRSRDGGESWERLSDDLTRNDKSTMGPSGGPITKDNTAVEYYGTIFAALESPHQPGVFWTGSDDGLVHLSRDDGATWTDVTPQDLPKWVMINSLEADPFEPAGLYLAATAYKSDDLRPYLYKTADWGATWKRIDAGIPRDQFTRVVRADPERRGLLYAGTERGVWLSFDDGTSWRPLQLELPIVPITDLAVEGNDLVAATQGRGFWILDDLGLLRRMSTEIAAAAGAHLFEPDPAYAIAAGGEFLDTPSNAGENPPSGVVLYYLLSETPAAETPFQLEILEDDGDVVWTFTRKPAEDEKEKDGEESSEGPKTALLDTEPGLNRFVWDMTYPPMERFPGLVLWNDSRHGPAAVPGTYRARLVVGENSSEVPIEILEDPRADASLADLQAQFDFVVAVRDELSEIHRELGRVRAVREQLDRLEKQLGEREDVDALEAAIEAVREAMQAPEEALYQTKNRSRQDPLNFPIRLNDKLAAVMRVAATGDARPTTQAVEVRDRLVARADTELARLREVWETQLPELNRLALAAKIEAVHLGD